jgi:nicotinamide phosphoribosyltransferase
MKIIKRTDSYKPTHWNMLPEGTEYVYSYFESRKGAKFEKTPFFGLQAIIKKYFIGSVVTQADIEQAALLFKAHYGDETYFNRKGWEYILETHGGKLPLRIRAVPEGTPVTVNNVLMTVENTDPKCAWLTNYVESVLTHVWYPSTVAALSRATKEVLVGFLARTSDNPAAVNFMLHDFGYRGATCDEAAAIGGAGHLLNFLGTDTLVAMDFAIEYYKADLNGLAYSVAATEHSIMTARGPHGEEDILDDLLNKYPKGILATVADSFDIYNYVENLVCKKFKDRILARDGVLVVRPDSITPLHPTPESETLWIVQTLANNMGYTLNSKGFMVLNPKVRVLWGDGIDKDGIEKILTTLEKAGFSAENMVFGMGGGLLQKVNRDTQRFAFKSSAQCRNGTWHDVYKLPKDLSKASKRGRLALVKYNDGTFATVPEHLPNYQASGMTGDLLETVFLNGDLVKEYTFTEVRNNAAL